MSSESRRFQPGDIVRVVRHPSEDWIRSGPVRVTGYHNNAAIDVEALDGDHAGRDGFGSYCLYSDCELDTFLDAAHKAVRDA